MVVDSSHWYSRSGESVYEVMGKNGKLRSTTLADARVLDLIPAVSTILKVAASPALEIWKINQMKLACMTLPRLDGETEKDFLDRIEADAKETAKKAAQRGTAIHKSVQNHFEGSVMVNHPAHAHEVEKVLFEYFGKQNWQSEINLFGGGDYGGRCDLVSFDGDGIVADLKTKEFTDPSKISPFSENGMQLAAYRRGFHLPKARCVNIFVSVQEPVKIKIVEWSQEELACHFEMFFCLLRFYYLKTGLGKVPTK